MALFCGPADLVVPEMLRPALQRHRARVLAAIVAFSAASLTSLAQTAHFSGVHTVVPTTGLNGVYGIAVDGNGNIYIADTLNTRVVKETLSGGTYTQSVVTSNISFVTGVAVDGSGNVYVADSSANRLLKETPSGGGYVESTIASGLAMPNYVAVDVHGNVYVAGTGNSQGLNDNPVYKETPSGSGYTQSIIVNMKVPNGVAVDANSDVYVIDYTSEQIWKETPSGGTYTQSVVPTSGIAYPAAIAADANGDVYVLNEVTNEALFKETLSGGTYVQSEVSDGFSDALGVAVGADGQVYVADSTNEQVFKVSASGDFGTISVGQSSAKMTLLFTFDSAGTIQLPAVLTQGATGLDFADAGTGTCTSNGTAHSYSAGDTCTMDVVFKPKYPGTRYGAAVLSDASGNVIATGYVQGTGLGPQVNFLPAVQSTVPVTGLVSPYHLSLDGSGNLYIVDQGAGTILKETLSGGTFSQSTLFTGLNQPTEVAVDGSGDLYILEWGNNRVLKETPSVGGHTQSVVVTGLNGPMGMAVDGAGSLYIADSQNNRALKEAWSPETRSYAESEIGTGLVDPIAIAVDGRGNVYITDPANKVVLLEKPSQGTYVQSTITTNLTNPVGIAVGGNGTVYIADQLKNEVLIETPSGGTYAESTIGSGLSNPEGVAVDGTGNLFISDEGNRRVLKEDLADPPSLTFASTVELATSSDSPQIVTIENTGNADLHFPVPGSGNNPSTGSSFTLNNSATAACPIVAAGAAGPGTLATGSSCEWSVSFVPASVGAIASALVLTDDSLNATSPNYATQSIALSGTGTAQDFTIGVASGTPSSATVPAGGQASYTLAIAPTTGTKFAAAIALAVSGLPSGAASTFSPSTVAANSAATNVTLTVKAPATASAEPAGRPFRDRMPVALALVLLAGLGRLRRGSRSLRGIICAVVLGLAGLATLTACGGGGNSGGGGGTPQTYAITVTATAGSLSHSTTVTLTVQ